MPENNGDHTKTTLQRTLEKSHDFDVKAVFLRANQMTKANFATLIQACIVLVVVFVIIGAITQPYIGLTDFEIHEHSSHLLKLPLFLWCHR